MYYPGYYYGGYSAPYYSVYLLLLAPVLLLSVWAQTKVQGNFKKFSRVANRRGLTGAQAAEAVLRANGIMNVRIESCRGSLTDHYDPRGNVIRLSDGVYSATTVAAVGVAAHEAGHAVQYAVGYFPIKIRNLAVPLTQFGSKFSFIFLLIGMVLYSQ
ncbi:MAG: zinc metallopeptidase, partial [Oscillospiraceae bacterium]|nr:zinc metallopeptidase [Oscillospiraceae bacterium]